MAFWRSSITEIVFGRGRYFESKFSSCLELFSHKQNHQLSTFSPNWIRYFRLNNFKKKIHFNTIAITCSNCRCRCAIFVRFLCDLTNIFNNSTFVPVRVSLFCFFVLSTAVWFITPPTIRSCYLRSFPIIFGWTKWRDVPAHWSWWSSFVEVPKGLYCYIWLCFANSFAAVIFQRWIFIVTFYVTLPISSLQFSFTNAKRVYSLSHFIVPPTRKSFVTFFFALSIPCFANSLVAVFHQRSFVLFLVPAFRPSTIQGFFYYTTLLPPTKRSINNFLFGLFCVFTW